jgi:hypothetical protein
VLASSDATYNLLLAEQDGSRVTAKIELASHIMHRFEVGDWVEVIGGLVAPNMKQGTILRVLSHFERPERLNEYEVRFGLRTALHYETHLRAISTAFDQD